MKSYTLTEVSRMFQISKHTLRYYDEIGILHPTKSQNGYRSFNENDIFLLKVISTMKYAQFSLKEIQLVLSLLSSEPSDTCFQTSTNFIEEKVIEIENRITHYQLILQLLKGLPDVKSTEQYLSQKPFIEEALIDIYEKIKGDKQARTNEVDVGI